MQLKILLPYGVFACIQDVTRVVVMTPAGSFGLLPHRLDCATVVSPGLLSYSTARAPSDPVASIAATAPDVHLPADAATTPNAPLAAAGTSTPNAHLAVDAGVLVKTGSDVLVCVRHAIAGADLGSLRKAVDQEFLNLSDQEKSIRTTLAHLESGLIRQFLELQRA
jgi:F-type H+-transporting ATPase subunit epsilon